MPLNASIIIFGLNHYYFFLPIFIIFTLVEFQFLHFIFFTYSNTGNGFSIILPEKTKTLGIIFENPEIF